jgi:hypothetical protein
MKKRTLIVRRSMLAVAFVVAVGLVAAAAYAASQGGNAPLTPTPAQPDVELAEGSDLTPTPEQRDVELAGDGDLTVTAVTCQVCISVYDCEGAIPGCDCACNCECKMCGGEWDCFRCGNGENCPCPTATTVCYEG